MFAFHSVSSPCSCSHLMQHTCEVVCILFFNFEWLLASQMCFCVHVSLPKFPNSWGWGDTFLIEVSIVHGLTTLWGKKMSPHQTTADILGNVTSHLLNLSLGRPEILGQPHCFPLTKKTSRREECISTIILGMYWISFFYTGPALGIHLKYLKIILE